MQPTRSLAAQAHPRFLSAIGALALSFLAGCGLAMDSDDRLARGEQALADGDQRTAIIDAKDVLRKEPDNLRGRLLLGRASVKVGDGPAAEKELRKAIELGADAADIAAEFSIALLLQGKYQEVLDSVSLDGLPDDTARATVLRAHGDANMGLNRPEVARELYTSSLGLRPNDLDAQLGVVSSFIAEANFAQAQGALQHVLESNSEASRAWLYSGSFNARMRDYESAEANYRAALELAEGQDDKQSRILALAGVAESLLEQQRADDARQFVSELETDAPGSFQTQVLVARIAYLDEDWNTAQRSLQKTLQVAPDFRPAQMLLGAVHLRSGNLSQAEMYLSSAVASMPNDITARQLLAETRLQMRKSDEAQEVLQPIIDSPNADPASLQLAARASLGQHDVDEAIAFLQRSVDQNPSSADLRFQLAATLIEVGRTDDAQEVLDQIDVGSSGENTYRRDALFVVTALGDGQAATALKKAEELAGRFGERSGAFSLLGAIQLANKDVDSATRSFEKALAIDATEIVPRRYLAAIAEATNDLGAAGLHYGKIVEQQPDAVWAVFASGRVAYRQGNFLRAAENFRKASEAAPDNLDFRLSVAKADRQLGKSAEAMKVLEDDLERVLNHLPSAIMLGMLKAESGDIDSALDISEIVSERYPDNAASYALKGELQIAAGKMTLADAAYDKAVQLGPVRSHAIRSYQIKRDLGLSNAQQPLLAFLEARPLDNSMRAVLAEAYLQADDVGKSVDAYERVVADEPQNVVALNNLAWGYYLTEDPRAIETAQKAFDLAPDNGAIADTLGWIMLQTGSVEEAEPLLRRAVEMENGRAEIRYHHAVALIRLGKMVEGRDVLEKILMSDEPFASRADAQKLLSEL